MTTLSRRSFLGSMAVLPVVVASDDWIPLFDGTTLEGWRASENTKTWSVRNGCLESDGPRSHLFYAGKVRDGSFRNFELKGEVMTRPGANSGIFFHTRFQPDGFPRQGFEVQVCNTCEGEGTYRERKKTGSLYGVRNVYKAFARDDEWFRFHISVRGKSVQVRLNDTLLVDYVEPEKPVIVSNEHPHVLGSGTFALQGHDAGSKVRFRNILVRPLSDDLESPTTEMPTVDEVYVKLLRLSDQNYPLVDYHVHLKGGWTLEEALKESRRTGIQYGIAVNCGVGFPITDDKGIHEFLRTMEGQPVFLAMQGEGREWVKMFSTESVAKFDYVFTDAMTFADDRGKRMRLWINEEVGEIPDKQRFMDVIVDRILGVLNHEPIDIYVNPTFLPRAMAPDYDEFWTPERMAEVIEAAKRNDVAIEINNRYRIPSARFLKLAKQAGIKFSFGTNNTDRNLGRLEYCLDMVDECALTWQDIFVPRPEGQKAVQRRPL
jgi:hypothetical protein